MIRQDAHEKLQAYFQKLWSGGDPWDFANSNHERDRFARLIASISDRRYENVLEIGCAAGEFTRLLAPISSNVVAVDIAPAAIELARSATSSPNVEYRVANGMELTTVTERQWDLIVMTETIYYLGWLYSFFDVAWLAGTLFTQTAAGGRLLLSNSSGDLNDPLLLPWIIATYHDLFCHVGFEKEKETISRGGKNGMEWDLVISVFEKRSNVLPMGFG